MPEGAISIRPETAGDRQAIYELHRQAFDSDVEPQLVDALRESRDAEISLAAVADGEVIGHVLFSRLEAPMRALALAPVAVLPGRQRRGVGSELIRAALREAEQEGWEAIFVVGEPEYYGRFGFDVEAARGFNCVYVSDYFMVLYLSDSAPTNGAINYPPPFAALG